MWWPLLSLCSDLASAMPMNIHNVSNIFVQLRRHRQRASEHNDNKGHHIKSTSGDEPQTHPGLASSSGHPSGLHLSRDEFFICADGVDVPRLLKVTRSALYKQAVSLGGNVLVDEEWDCTICGPKHRRSGNFHVKIHYDATALRSETRDPGLPPNLQRSKGVPGLMTIISHRPSL